MLTIFKEIIRFKLYLKYAKFKLWDVRLQSAKYIGFGISRFQD